MACSSVIEPAGRIERHAIEFTRQSQYHGVADHRGWRELRYPPARCRCSGGRIRAKCMLTVFDDVEACQSQVHLCLGAGTCGDSHAQVGELRRLERVVAKPALTPRKIPRPMRQPLSVRPGVIEGHEGRVLNQSNGVFDSGIFELRIDAPQPARMSSPTQPGVRKLVQQFGIPSGALLARLADHRRAVDGQPPEIQPDARGAQ
jgi:hypothetical protein